MTPAKRRLLQERLSGIEFRNQLRRTIRRSIMADSIERRRLGRAREYHFDREKRA